MDFREMFALSFESLKERKVKSALTIVMVMVGSSLLVAVNGIGAGFVDFFNQQFSNLAPNLLFVSSVQQNQDSGGGGGIGSAGSPSPSAKITLNAAVVNRINSLPFIYEVIPSYQSQITIESQGKSKSHNVLSLDPTKLLVIAPTLDFVEGSAIRQNDPSAIIVANDIANPPGEDTPFITLGQSVRVKYSFVDPNTGKPEEDIKNFVVRGIMMSTGNPTIDGAVVINKDSGNSFLQKSGKFDSLFVAARSSDFVDIVENEIRQLYGNDIGITTVKAILKTIEQFTGGINAFLSSIAIVSLVVGAVGIITTLYTSVIERVKEIGTLKAIGAQNRNILTLFLIEALLIGIFGATFGLVTGIGMGYGMSAAFGSAGNTSESNTGNSDNNDNDIEESTSTNNSSSSSLSPVYLVQDMARVWIISVVLSLFAGLFPAWKASRYLPIEALRTQ
ncbi:MAG: ABC transporter permease [Nitrosopumilus sp.]|nr:ABC transporter permease [Nitrosopumilus sp.]